MLFPHPALHNPSRFLPQNQAILTTYDDWRVILSNDVAGLVLVGTGGSCRGLVGNCVVDYIEPTYRSRFLDMVMRRREELGRSEDNTGGMVLVCGNVLPIVKQDGTRSAASLWLKEKRNDAGSSVYIWIFEEGTIHYVDDAVQDLYGYRPDELIGATIDTLIPSLAKDKRTGWQDVNRLRSFGSKTKLGAHFPIIAKIHTVTPPLKGNADELSNGPCFTLRITSIPMIAGLVTIRRTGIIDGCNAAFAGYMFGLSQEELVKKDIAELVPQFPRLLYCLQRDDLLQHGIIINNLICRKLVADDKSVEKFLDGKPRRLTQAPNGQSLPVLIAIHRDQTPIEVQLQLKLVEGSDDVCALWITYDREATFARVGHSQSATTPLELKQHNGLGLPAARRPIPSDNTTDNKNDKPTPITMRSATMEHKRSSLQHQIMPATPPALVYSAQTNATSIDDFEILENLGQGAYGLVKVAVRKDDPERKKVVIKYVIKSRILVDCWIKDRKLGVIPVEIHILHTLRKIPHKNCSDMLDYFEDDDHYYIVMGLHGAGMDLFDYIELKEGMADKEIQCIFRQIAEAVQHLHEHKIVHRDIKDENVVLDQDGGVRLIDFGSAAYLKGRRYDTFVGTLDYAAPEILAGKTYEGPPQDIWALGILLYTLVYRENPFYDIDEILGHELRVPFVLSEGSLDLIRKMLDRNEDKRLTIQEVLAHPWLNQE
ncbi:kinase-like domain-containing protein [Syncephalastrum racemosum]|uniref:non-specific serine/threonine protein kinase n=1 Tax=Syncephalastrum racemosum TaxID=13706 RepID=A0A1X2HCD4_SYNRA|nr:kinase-like domain-containing protein [Syncephalastrum racemosum]